MLLQLPDHCLLLVLEKLDFCSQAALANVCNEMKNFIRIHTFQKITNFIMRPMNRNDIILSLIAVTRFVRLMNPKNFQLKMYRNLEQDKNMPIVSIDITHPSAPCEVFVESHFLRYSRYLELLTSRIELVKIFCSIYDCHANDGVGLANIASWSNVNHLSIGGYSLRILHSIDFPQNLWQLKTISFHKMRINSDFINHVATSIGKHLESITFENCKFQRFLPNDIIAVAEGVRDRGGHFPLGLIFVNAEVKGDALLWAMENADVQEYIYIQFGERDSL